MTIGFAATPTGERLAVGVYPNGRRSVRSFDARGLLQSRGEQGLELAWLHAAAAATAGDVDGDGVAEHVGRN